MIKKIYSSLFLLFLLNSCSVSDSKFRNGDIHTDDISGLIKDAIDYFIGIAGTIAVIFIIIGAYQMLFGSVSGDSKGKDTITSAIIGFAIAVLAWFIVKLIFDNLS